RRAKDLDLDLVEVAPQAQPPVCRIMDYGKFKYERAVQQKEARKRQSRVEVKEIKMRPKIDPHDYGIKKGHVIRFLQSGARVKVTIMFRGREMAHTGLGWKLLDRLTGDLQELATVEAYPKLDGRNMVMVLGPVKRPASRTTSKEAHGEAGRSWTRRKTTAPTGLAAIACPRSRSCTPWPMPTETAGTGRRSSDGCG